MYQIFFLRATTIFFALATVAFFVFPYTTQAAFGDVATYVGKIIGGDGKDKLESYLDQPKDFAVDANGNFYVADTMNNVVRKIASDGKVSTVAGTGAYGDIDGDATKARFAWPEAIALDGSTIFLADTDNSKIKKISGGKVTILVASGLSKPKGLYADTETDTLYIADTGNNAIKKVSFSGGTVSKVASSGLAAPTKMTKNGNTLYVANTGNSRIVAVDISSGSVTTLASGFLNIGGVYFHENAVYEVDGDGLFDFLQKVSIDGTKTLIAEDEHMITLNTSAALLIRENKIYVLNSGSSSIYRFDMDGQNPVHFAGKDRFGNNNGTGTGALIGRPKGLVLSHNRKFFYLSENNKIRKIERTTGVVTSLIGNSVDNYKEGRTGSEGRFSDITDLVISPNDTTLYVVDRNNNRIRGVDIANATDFLITGAGEINSNSESNNGYQEGKKCLNEFKQAVSGCSYFNRPAGIAISPDGNFLYVTDSGNHRVRRVRVSDGETTPIAGSGKAGFKNGVGSAAEFNSPFSIAIDHEGAFLYVADKNNHAIRRIRLSDRKVETLTGTGRPGYNDATFDKAVFSFPEYLTFGGDGHVYVSEVGGQRIRQLDLEEEVTKLVAGSGIRGYRDGKKNDAQFNNPKGLFVDAPDDRMYMTDNFNDLIRVIDIEGEAPFTEQAPKVSRVDPNTKTIPDAPDVTLFVSVTGSNFRHGAQAIFGTFDAVNTYVESETKLAVEFPFGLMSPGSYDVTVRNVDTQQHTLLKGFRVANKDGSVPDVYFRADGTVTGGSAPAPAKSTFFPYDSKLVGGFYPLSCDLTGDGVAEIITGPGVGFGPQVRVFQQNGKELFSFFAYAETLRSGVRIACGDLTGDRFAEIVTAPGPSGRPHIRIFDHKGAVKHPGFFALDGLFQGGAYVAVGDVDGDRRGDIIVTAGKGGGPQVTVHRMDGTMLANFFAYDKNTFRGGIRPALLDFDDDGIDEIIVGPEFGASHIQMFSVQKNIVKQLNPGFFAFDADLHGGVSVAGGDIDGDGIDEIIVGAGLNATPLVRVFNKTGSKIIKEVLAFVENFAGGVNVTAGDTDGDGVDDIIVMPRSENVPTLRVLK